MIPAASKADGLLDKRQISRSTRRKLTKWGIITGNCVLLLAVAVFVISNRSTSQTLRSSTANSLVATAESVYNPLDQLSSAEIAAQVAQLAGLTEQRSVRNQADSENALLAIIPNDSTTLAKPQIVSTGQKSKYDIIRYHVKNGDTVDSIADDFHVTVGSITGSNDLAGTAVTPGTELLIPPANGIVYKVNAGDTVQKIVAKYGADKDLFVSVNDAEYGLRPGDLIWIPNVSEPGLSLSYAPIASYSISTVPSYTPTYGYNGYDYGFCTWYVASRIAVPSNWGNANTWDDYARNTPGWTVGLAPRVGAVAQTDAGGLGHVAVVTAVSSDGKMMKYADMNGLAGWGAVGYSDWVPAGSKFEHYIFR